MYTFSFYNTRFLLLTFMLLLVLRVIHSKDTNEANLFSDEWINRTYFVRVQKTAGSSFFRNCQDQAGPSKFWCDIAFLAHWDLPNMKLFAPPNTIFITWLRDPLSRTVSEFHYMKKQPGALRQEQWDYHPKAALTLKLLRDPLNVSIEEFIESAHAPVNNRMSRYFGDTLFATKRPVTRVMLNLPGTTARSWPIDIPANKFPPAVGQAAFEKRCQCP